MEKLYDFWELVRIDVVDKAVICDKWIDTQVVILTMKDVLCYGTGSHSKVSIL